jgi:hypothetical protein
MSTDIKVVISWVTLDSLGIDDEVNASSNTWQNLLFEDERTRE